MNKKTDLHGRVTEWEVSAQDDGYALRLFAWAQYGRGSRPTDVELERLERRVHAKHPSAELVSMKRTCVRCVGGGRARRVVWQLCWLVEEG